MILLIGERMKKMTIFLSHKTILWTVGIQYLEIKN